MVDVEIFGGKDDGKVITVSETVARSGFLRVPGFSVVAFEKDPENYMPPPIETWKITEFCTATGALKLKAVESSMWSRMNR